MIRREAWTNDMRVDMNTRNENWDKLEDLDNKVDDHLADKTNPHSIYAKKAQSGWITGTLQSGWTGTLKYKKNDLNQVCVVAYIAPGTTDSLAVVGALPVGYRPTYNVPFIMVSDQGTASQHILYLNQNGNIYIAAGSSFSTAYSYACVILFETEVV